MTESNHLFAAAIAAAGMALAEFYAHLAPWLLLGAVLVLVDLRFGVRAARKRGEEIRLSRMWRGSFNKAVDYLCWVSIAEGCSRTFEMTLGYPVVSMAILFVIYGYEINSCVNNYLEYKGINKKFNIYRLVDKEDLLESDKSPEAEND